MTITAMLCSPPRQPSPTRSLGLSDWLAGCKKLRPASWMRLDSDADKKTSLALLTRESRQWQSLVEASHDKLSEIPMREELPLQPVQPPHHCLLACLSALTNLFGSLQCLQRSLQWPTQWQAYCQDSCQCQSASSSSSSSFLSEIWRLTQGSSFVCLLSSNC